MTLALALAVYLLLPGHLPRLRADQRVVDLITIVGVLVMTTLRAMKNIGSEGTCDVWLLDEGDDAEVRRACGSARPS